MRRVVTLVVAAVAAATLGPPAVAAPPRSPNVRVWHLTRPDLKPRPLDMTVHTSNRDEYAALMIAGINVLSSGRRDALGARRAAYIELGQNTLWPYAYSSGSTPIPMTTPDCPEAALCTGPGPTPGTFDALWRDDGRNDDGRPAARDFYVAGYNIHATITVRSPGWSVREITGKRGVALHVAYSRDGLATGARSNHVSVERFRGVSANGGVHGSIAFAEIPCWPIAAYVYTGVGASTLFGGDDSWNRLMECSNGYAAASARGPTRWSNAGDVIGYGNTLTRLAVFDLPKP